MSARRRIYELMETLPIDSDGYRLLDRAYWHLAGKANWHPVGSRQHIS